MFYNDIYYSADHRKKMGWAADLTQLSPQQLAMYQARMDFVENFTGQELRYPRGKLLDIGCSTGYFLLEAKLRYWEVQGIEISDKAASVAREHLRLPVKTGVLTEKEFEAESFDVVTAWDVLEHISDPNPLMEQVYRVLKRGGLFILNTPNVSSSAAYFTGKDWRHLDPPLHTVLYDFMSIRILLKKHNFAIVKICSGEEYLGQMKVAAKKI
jgi:2-polyprenyl-3-methyl-5-hydroxy-6-metoxy-1,4-benzoquinol methylase